MRELAISIYLMGFKALFTIFKLFPLKKKVTFLISFSDNPLYIYEALKKKASNRDVVFLCQQRCFETFKATGESTYLVESKNLLHSIIGIYHLATSKQIVVDNYYGFLAVTKFKEGVTCTQIWHAAGAIKQFGAEDPTNVHRTSEAISRFKAVYDRFDQIVIGSDFMGEIFKQAFLKEDDALMKIGVPRTDFFFNEALHAQIKDAFYQEKPELKGKKIILYAPTFRKEDTSGSIPLDFQKLYASFKEDYVLFIRMHPSIELKMAVTTEYHDFIFDYSQHPSINDLLVMTDVLITDYSSIPMEFSILQRQMIFFAYDLEAYKKSNGLWEVYETSVPGLIAKNTDEIINAVLHGGVDRQEIAAYSDKWVKYCDGNASMRFVEEVLTVN